MIFVPRNPADNAALCAWAEARIPGAEFKMYQTIGVIRGGDLVAVAVYHEYRPPCVEMSFAADHPRWATPQTVERLLSYPFDRLKVRRITGCVKRRNRKIRRLIEGIGFKLEGTLHRAYEDDDACVYGFFRENLMRYRRNGNEVSTVPTAAAG